MLATFTSHPDGGASPEPSNSLLGLSQPRRGNCTQSLITKKLLWHRNQQGGVQQESTLILVLSARRRPPFRERQVGLAAARKPRSDGSAAATAPVPSPAGGTKVEAM